MDWWYFSHIVKAGGTVVAEVLSQCMEQLGGHPCRTHFDFDHVCVRPKKDVEGTRKFVQGVAQGDHNCSLVELHHDHSLLQFVRRGRVNRSMISFVLLREPVRRTISSWYQPRGGSIGALANWLDRVKRAQGKAFNLSARVAQFDHTDYGRSAQDARMPTAHSVPTDGLLLDLARASRVRI